MLSVDWSSLKDRSLIRQQALLDGHWQDAQSGQSISVYNPASQQLVGQVPNMGAAETVTAIESAQRAFQQWKLQSSHQRSEFLQRFCQLLLENAEDVARIITVEQGKPLRESRAEVRYAASFLQWFAEQAKRVQGEVLSSPWSDRRMLTWRQPLGVAAAITPWNFPAAMITRKVAPALAAGCTMIVKPSEWTPLTALALGELACRAGLPQGVFQIVTGEAAEIGQVLSSSQTVRKLSFTGSTRVGRILAEQCGRTVKRLSLELGGHAPFIVFQDADLNQAVEGALASKYRNAGQTCICSNRFYIHDDLFDQFATLLVERTKALRGGPGDDPSVDVGPRIHPSAVTKVQVQIDDALQRGANLLTGGQPHWAGVNFFQPTILAGVTEQMLVAHEETFGPVCPLIRFHDQQEVIRLANQTDYGLAAYIYSRDLSRVWRVAEQLDFGMVGVNTGSISTEVAPFGGVKQSGYGREGAQTGIDEYLEVKYVCLALDETSTSSHIAKP